MNTAQTVWLWIMTIILAVVSFFTGWWSTDMGPFTSVFIFMIPFALIGIAIFKTLGPHVKKQQGEGKVLHRVEQLVSAAIPDEDKE